ncbi:cell division suppressor protein YneA [Brevibacillus borstelensis]|uniref:cell division suppressor protein YneA n=1 Tax=Brevibacillus borstelensis TaxID=45462 RepID=UPI0030C061D6
MSTMTVSDRFAKKEVRGVRFGVTRGQAILFFAAFTLFFYTLTELVFASDNHSTQQQIETSQPVIEITVQPGDSLWNLAIAYKTDPKKDVRDMVYAIRELNKLESAIIYPGQTILIPVGN